jgi:hypothetical protein
MTERTEHRAEQVPGAKARVGINRIKTRPVVVASREKAAALVMQRPTRAGGWQGRRGMRGGFRALGNYPLETGFSKHIPFPVLTLAGTRGRFCDGN